MTIPPRFLDDLRARVTLSDVVRKKVRLTRAGREYKGCCPFHNEKTPSFYVNDDKQFYHCFGCGAHGSAIDFTMQAENLSFPEAVEALALSVGMQVPQSSPQDIEKAKQEKSLYTLLDEAARWMEDALRAPASKVPYDYIKQRGVPDDILSSFRIGYAPGDGQAIRKHLTGLGYTDAQMLEAGVLKASAKGGEPYAFFRERIMFPVPDRRGRIVAFGGRILPDHLRPPDKGDYKPAKYMNSSDTPLFHKGGMLYGEPHARHAAQEGQPIVVVEGYLDVIACFQAGYRGAVAPLGTALTEDQILVLWKMIPSAEKVPVLCFDGDEAGRRAASRAAERLLPHLKPNHSARIAFLPEGQDPDSLVKEKGPQALEAVITYAMPLVEFLWRQHTQGKDFATPEARAGLSHTLDEETLRIADRTVQHYYREAFRAKTREAFSPPQAARTGNRPPFTPGFTPGRYVGNGKYAPPPQALSPLKRPSFSRPTLVAMALLAAILNHPILFESVEEDLGQLPVPEKELDQLRQAVLSTLGHNSDLDAEGLRTHLMEQGFEEVLTRILSDAVYIHAGFAKPQTPEDDVRQGWLEAWNTIHESTARLDMEAAKAALRADLNEGNENRFKALQETKKNQS